MDSLGWVLEECPPKILIIRCFTNSFRKQAYTRATYSVPYLGIQCFMQLAIQLLGHYAIQPLTLTRPLYYSATYPHMPQPFRNKVRYLAQNFIFNYLINSKRFIYQLVEDQSRIPVAAGLMCDFTAVCLLRLLVRIPSGNWITVSYGFYICSSVHRNSRLKKSNNMQLYADIYLQLNYSTCFGRPSQPSSEYKKLQLQPLVHITLSGEQASSNVTK